MDNETAVYKRRPAFLNVILAANPKTLREVREMIMTQGLREALVDLGLAAEWERQGEARGEARGEITGVGLAVDLFKKGYTPDEIERMLANGSLPLDGKG